MKGCIDENPNKCSITKTFLEENDFGIVYRCPVCYTTELKGSIKEKVSWFSIIFIFLLLTIICTILSFSFGYVLVYKSEWLNL
jgi:hypothetical protein